MLRVTWTLLKDSVNGYIEDDALSRGAAIAYYTIFSIAPLLVIVIAIAGLVYGTEAARGAIVGQLQGMIGLKGAEAIQTMIASANNKSSGILATALGIGTLLVTATGVFGEMQTGLNVIWKVKPDPNASTVSRMVRARAASLGLVAALGFLLVVSLAVSASITAAGHLLQRALPEIDLLLQLVNFLLSFGMVTLLFAAIYKVLPDKSIEWYDVWIGALATAFLFTLGKTAIGLYIGSSQVASAYGAAGALVIILLWVYYSAQIFLFGAEFTKAFAHRHGSHA
jgi:membrane protein